MGRAGLGEPYRQGDFDRAQWELNLDRARRRGVSGTNLLQRVTDVDGLGMDFCRQASLFLGLLNEDFCLGDVPGLKTRAVAGDNIGQLQEQSFNLLRDEHFRQPEFK